MSRTGAPSIAGTGDIGLLESKCASWEPGVLSHARSPMSHATRLLDAVKNGVVRQFASETGYSRRHCLALWSAIDRFCGGADQAIKSMKRMEGYESRRCRLVRKGCCVRYIPRGRVLCVVPGNAAIPLAAIVPLSMAATGNLAVVAFSSRARMSGVHIATCVQATCPDNVIVWTGGVRELLNLSIAQRLVDCVYFVGSSSHYPAMSMKCAEAGVDLMFEGEGNGIALVDHPIDHDALEQAIINILKAKQFCNGTMCSSPNVLLIHRKDLGEARRLYERLHGRYRLPASVAAIAGPDKWAEILNIAGPALAEAASVGSRRTPAWIEGVPILQAVSLELACPAIYVCLYDSLADVPAQIRCSRYRLQVSVFGNTAKTANEIAQAVPHARVCYNMCPTDQDPLLPWGNYARSGASAVVEFLRKGVVRTVFESWA